MPELTTSGQIWVGGIALGLVLWFVFVSPRLVPMLKMTMHGLGDDERRFSFVDIITLYMASVLMFVVAMIVSIMFYEVVMRYLFEAPTLWVEELSRWLGGVIFLMGGLYAMQQRAHIRVVIVYDMVSRNAQRVLDVFGTVCVVIFCYAVVSGYGKTALKKFETWELYGSAWNPPIPAVMKPLICIVCAWMAVQAISNLIMDWSKPKVVHDPADDL